jgi:hypothetical protein
VRRGNSLNKISAGGLANHRPDGLAVFVLPRVPDVLHRENHELRFQRISIQERLFAHGFTGLRTVADARYSIISDFATFSAKDFAP